MLKNQIWYGLALGLLIPFVICYIIFFAFDAFNPWYNLYPFIEHMKLAGIILRLCVIANMFFFIPFKKRPKMYFLRGVLIATVFYAILIVTIHLST